MEDLLRNKLFWLCIGLLMFNAVIFVVGKAVVDKAADEVIQRLEKDYSPSPYGPGFDPDKVSPDSLQPRGHLEMKTVAYSEVENTIENTMNSPILQIANASEWRDDWERDRGFSQ